MHPPARVCTPVLHLSVTIVPLSLVRGAKRPPTRRPPPALIQAPASQTGPAPLVACGGPQATMPPGASRQCLPTVDPTVGPGRRCWELCAGAGERSPHGSTLYRVGGYLCDKTDVSPRGCVSTGPGTERMAAASSAGMTLHGVGTTHHWAVDSLTGAPGAGSVSKRPISSLRLDQMDGTPMLGSLAYNLRPICDGLDGL